MSVAIAVMMLPTTKMPSALTNNVLRGQPPATAAMIGARIANDSAYTVTICPATLTDVPREAATPGRMPATTKLSVPMANMPSANMRSLRSTRNTLLERGKEEAAQARRIFDRSSIKQAKKRAPGALLEQVVERHLHEHLQGPGTLLGLHPED